MPTRYRWGRRSHPPLCSRVISSRCMSFCSVSSARLRPEHRTVPTAEPASLAGADQRRGGEERPAVRHSSQSSGDGADSLSYSVNTPHSHAPERARFMLQTFVSLCSACVLVLSAEGMLSSTKAAGFVSDEEKSVSPCDSSQ